MIEPLAKMEQIEAELLAYLRSRFDLKFSLIELLRRNAAQSTDQPAFLEPYRRSLTYERLLELATSTVQTLNALGLTPSSRVALALDTSTNSATVYACVMAGVAVIPLDDTSPQEEYERYLQHAGAAALIVRRGSKAASAAAQGLGLLLIEVEFPAEGPVGWFEIVSPLVAPEATAEFAGPDHIAAIILTSGTTSLPKLTPWSQRELAIICHFAIDAFYMIDAAPYPLIGLMPLQHVAGLFGVLRSICWQNGFACVPNHTADEIFRYLAFYQPANIYAGPPLFQVLVNQAPSFAPLLSRFQLQKINSVSAALSEQLRRDIQRTFHCAVQLHYGMTEIQTITYAIFAPGDTYPVGYVGQPHPFLELKIAADDGAALPANQIGEIMVYTPRAFKGYLDDPHANAEAFQNGWFRTGDSGYRNENGDLFITGRLKEMINRGGSKVAPVDIDMVLIQHPAVSEAASFPFRHSAYGEDIAAAIVLRDPGATERELRSFAAKHLALHKVPSRFVFVAALPKTTVGKVKRAELTAQFQAQLER